MFKDKNENKEDYFSTVHLKANLKKRSVRGVTITIIGQAVKFCTQMGSNVILGRLLTPTDYGLIGMVLSVVGLIGLFKDMGLSLATVQTDEINHQQVNTLFWINVLLSAVIMLLTATLSGAIAWFYQEPRLVGITLALSTAFIFGGLTVQHQALLNRQMRFEVVTGIDTAAIFLGFISAIICAYYGATYWSLVIMQLVTAIINVIGVWIMCSWRPSSLVLHSGVRPMLSFGGYLVTFQLINFFARNLDNILIGRYWGPQQLGYYAKSYQLLLLPLHQIFNPMYNVAVPGLSRLQYDLEQYRHYYLKTLSLLCFLTMPIILFLIVGSEEIVELLLGPQWQETVTIFRILGISALLQPINSSAGLLFVSRGLTKEQLHLGLYTFPIIIGSFFIGLPYGARGVALSYAIAILMQTPVYTYFAIQGTSISILDLFTAIIRPFLAAIAAGSVSYGIKLAIGTSSPMWTTVIICSICMTTVYLGIIFYIFRQKNYYLSILSHFKK
jgi:PST family polysaccharide transporter